MSARIQKIKETYSSQLKERLEQETVDISLDSAWNILVSADLTKNKKNIRWLVEIYINDGFRWEDIMGGSTSKVCETITEFDKHRHNLDTAERSLKKYQALGSLWKTIKPYVGQLTIGEEKRKERDKAYAEAEVIVDREDGLKIVIPKTKYASQWFGRGTRWCTASENNNIFEEYNDKAPLFIIFMPNGDKLQLWKNGNDIQFMDENDEHVSLDYISKYWNTLEPVINKFLCNIRYYPDEYKTYDMCLQAVSRNAWTLEFVPDKHKDYKMLLSSVKNDGSLLKCVPDEIKDYDMCLQAVKQNGWALEFIPDKWRDYNMCMEAVKQDGVSLKYISDKMKDYKMCMEAVKNNGWTLEFVPDKHKDYELCLETVKNNGWTLKYIPEKFKDYHMCLEAVKQRGWALEHVPEGFKDYVLCLYACKRSGWDLRYVPEELKNYNICMEAVKQNGGALEYVPEKWRDYNMCMEAVKSNGLALGHVPSNLYDYNLCLEAVKSNGLALEYVPKDMKDYNMCMEAVKQDNICVEAVKNNSYIFRYIPEKYREQIKKIDIDYSQHKEQMPIMKKIFQSPEPSLIM